MGEIMQTSIFPFIPIDHSSYLKKYIGHFFGIFRVLSYCRSTISRCIRVCKIL